MVDFSDLDDLDTAPVRPDRTAGQPQPAGTAPAMMRCTKCSGSGQTRWGECFPCKGTGQVSHDYDQSKLTEAQVLEIRDRYAAGESGKALADEFGIAQPTVVEICKRRTWRHI